MTFKQDIVLRNDAKVTYFRLKRGFKPHMRTKP